MVKWFVVLTGETGTDIISESSEQILDVVVVTKAGIGSMEASVGHVTMCVLEEIFMTVGRNIEVKVTI